MHNINRIISKALAAHAEWQAKRSRQIVRGNNLSPARTMIRCPYVYIDPASRPHEEALADEIERAMRG